MLLKSKIGFLITLVMGVALCMMRTNGKFVFVGLMIIIIFMFKDIRRTGVILTAAVIVINGVPNAVITFVGGEYAKSIRFQESVGIPLQQIGAAIAEGKITDEKDIEFIDGFFPFEKYKKSFSPVNSDPIKWDFDFNKEYLSENRDKFFGLWFRQLLKTPEIYIKEYIVHTQGIWSIGKKYKTTQDFFFTLAVSGNDKALVEMIQNENIRNIRILPTVLQDKLTSFYERACCCISGGSCFWIFLFIALLLVAFNRKALLPVMAPIILLWLTLMLATPLSIVFRYVFSYVLCLPIMAILPFIESNR